jgi:hypothetical protein
MSQLQELMDEAVNVDPFVSDDSRRLLMFIDTPRGTFLFTLDPSQPPGEMQKVVRVA